MKESRQRAELIEKIDALRSELDHEALLSDNLCEKSLIDACSYRTLALHRELDYLLSELERTEKPLKKT